MVFSSIGGSLGKIKPCVSACFCIHYLPVAKTISDLQSLLSSYVHPDRTFLQTLNEVLPQLASKGIWKDLTFEESITVDPEDSFFTLPEEADSILHGIVNNRPVPIKPLWAAFVNDGAVSGRGISHYGLEDAGLVATKSILANNNYLLYVLPRFSWGSNESLQKVYTDSPFAGTETIKIVYENFEGVTLTSTDTLTASADTQLLSPRAVRNIISIEYGGFNTVPALVLAAPANAIGSLNAGSGDITITPFPGHDVDYTEIYEEDANQEIFSLVNDVDTIDVNAVSADSIEKERIVLNSSYGGSTPVSDHPVVIVQETHRYQARTERGAYTEGVKQVAQLKGSGVTRYRLFRHHSPGNNVHLLLRRNIPTYVSTDEIVYIDNVSALKYALLANTAEHNNDPTQARTWWGEAKRELDDELSKSFGAAQPQVNFDPSSGHGAIESIF